MLRSVENLGRLEGAGRYHLLSGGKRLRGRLALAAGIAVDCPFPHALSTAIAVELLHNASLVHDDLQDRDERRRGQLAVWAKYGEPAAILLGDALIAESFATLGEVSSPHSGALIRSLSNCILSLASGQCSDGGEARQIDRNVDTYNQLALGKTGGLFALPPALICTHMYGPGQLVDDATSAFSLLGVAFQIFDDIADLTASKGRAVGSDLRSGRFSAAVMHVDAAAEGGGLPIEEQARRILASPRIQRALAHQDAVLRNASRAAADLPLALRDVLEDVADDVRSATQRLAFQGRRTPSAPGVDQGPDAEPTASLSVSPSAAPRVAQ